jgi:hypothetical protein
MGLGFLPPKKPELRRCLFRRTFASWVVERSSGIGPGLAVVDSGPNAPKLFLRSLFSKPSAITKESTEAGEREETKGSRAGGKVVEVEKLRSEQ